MSKHAGEYTDYLLWLRWNNATKKHDAHKHVWAVIEDLTADEQIAFLMKNSTASCNIRVRELHDISAKDRLQDGDEVYDLTGIKRGDDELIISANRLERTI